jgi:hypothetical protein
MKSRHALQGLDGDQDGYGKNMNRGETADRINE